MNGDPKAGDIYEARGIDRAQGCMVVVRPDQYVAQVLPLDAFAALSDYFAGALGAQDGGGVPGASEALGAFARELGEVGAG